MKSAPLMLVITMLLVAYELGRIVDALEKLVQ